jgi:hypothetical protein
MELVQRPPRTRPRRTKLAEEALNLGTLGEQDVDGVDQPLDVAARQRPADRQRAPQTVELMPLYTADASERMFGGPEPEGQSHIAAYDT